MPPPVFLSKSAQAIENKGWTKMGSLGVHTGFGKKEGTKRGHVSRTWGKITASVTICQVRN